MVALQRCAQGLAKASLKKVSTLARESSATALSGQNKSAVIADLMREAVEREQRRKQHCSAVDRILANRINAPRFSEAEFNAAREEGRE